MAKQVQTIYDQIHDYLACGGLFNPELADHDAVRELVINCNGELRRRDFDIAMYQAEIKRLKRKRNK